MTVICLVSSNVDQGIDFLYLAQQKTLKTVTKNPVKLTNRKAWQCIHRFAAKSRINAILLRKMAYCDYSPGQLLHVLLK